MKERASMGWARMMEKVMSTALVRTVEVTAG